MGNGQWALGIGQWAMGINNNSFPFSPLQIPTIYYPLSILD
jgi:hypothetical protein